MALDHTPLTPEQLPPQVARAVGPSAPGPARMMAAKGLAPMGPGELLTAVYQLSLDTDQQLAHAAQQTAGALPDKILGAALGEPLDPRVLDFFALKLIARGELIEKILLNGATADETFVALAGKLAEREVEILAGNQQRLLRCPAIIEALYFNRAARMSTVDRLLQLAVRHGIRLERVPQFDAIVREILGTGTAAAGAAEQPAPAQPAPAASVELDQVFSSLLAQGWDEGPVGGLEYDPEQEEVADEPLTVNQKIRLATIGNMFHRIKLVRDSNRLVAMAVIQSAAVTDQEAARYAADRGLREDIIRYIANKKEWQKSYQVKLALVNNPKTPLAYAIKTLRYLRQSDVRALARSKSIPAAVAKAAKQLSHK